MPSQELFYQDLDAMMEINEVTGDFIIKKNVYSIKQSVKNLLKLHFYDKIWMAECGSYFHNLLFSQNDGVWLSLARDAIYRILTKYEPRIKLHSVTLTPQEFGEVDIEIVYEIIITGARDTFNYKVTRVR